MCEKGKALCELLTECFPSSCQLAFHIVVKGSDLFLFQSVGHIDIDIHRRRYISVSQNTLNEFEVCSRLTEPCCEGVPENVTTELWQKNRSRVSTIFFEDFIIAISHNTAEGFVEVSLILNIPITVDENEVVIAVHSTFTADFSLRLKLSLH